MEIESETLNGKGFGIVAMLTKMTYLCKNNIKQNNHKHEQMFTVSNDFFTEYSKLSDCYFSLPSMFQTSYFYCIY